MVKFRSKNPNQFIGYRQLPPYPLSSLKIMVSGVDFSNGVFETDDEVLIACIRRFIEGWKGIGCPVWEDGSKRRAEPPVPVAKRVEGISETDDEMLAEFKRLLRA
jgi:hypothetical protein